MASKAITEQDMNNLKEHLGERWAKWVSDASEAQGKAVENAGVRFKMPMGEDDEDDGKMPMEDDEDKGKEVTISKSELVLFSAVKESAEVIHGLHNEVAQLTKTVKDLSNQVDQLRTAQGDSVDGVRRMNSIFGELLDKTPASKSGLTAYQQGTNPLVDEVEKKNLEGQKSPEPVFNQMAKNNGITIPDSPPVSD